MQHLRIIYSACSDWINIGFQEGAMSRLLFVLLAQVIISFAGTFMLVEQVRGQAQNYPTETAIKHLVIIFQENRTFDHYFATYPNAANSSPDEPVFLPSRRKLRETPPVNGLISGLISGNLNTTNPFRLGRDEAATCDPAHTYMVVQQAVNLGLLDRFPQTSGLSSSTCVDTPGIVMGNLFSCPAGGNYGKHRQ